MHLLTICTAVQIVNKEIKTCLAPTLSDYCL